MKRPEPGGQFKVHKLVFGLRPSFRKKDLFVCLFLLHLVPSRVLTLEVWDAATPRTKDSCQPSYRGGRMRGKRRHRRYYRKNGLAAIQYDGFSSAMSFLWRVCVGGGHMWEEAEGEGVGGWSPNWGTLSPRRQHLHGSPLGGFLHCKS